MTYFVLQNPHKSIMAPNNKINPFESIFILLVFVFLSSLSNNQCATNQYLYAPASLCINCPLACADCTNSFTCTSCESTASLVATTTTTKCFCQNGKYYDPKLLVCDACNKVIPNCNKCTTGLSSTVCLTCNANFYLYSSTSCAACPPKCKTCTSATNCLTCIFPDYSLVNGDCICDTKCTTCLVLDTECINCNTNNCKKCGVGYKEDNKVCITCGTGCLQCGGKCNNCFPGYFLDKSNNNNICQLCSTIFSDPFCTECESYQCTVCQAGYRLNMATLICVPDVIPTCSNTQILIDTTCILCSIIFDPLCNTCDQSGCLTCQTGYMIDTNTNTCMKIPICGDGDWIFAFEDCDDRNLINGDGCSALCLVETDYECLQADKLSTGESLCKYTKEFVVNLMYVLKQQSSNVAFFYFNFQATTFLLWTDTQLLNFLSPIQIVDSNTGTGNLMPCNSLVIDFYIVNGQSYFMLTVDYGQQNIQNTYIKFAMDPTQTSLSQINTKTIQPDVFHFIDSKTNAANLYNYAADIYDKQKIIYTLSGVLGYASFVFLFLGLISPVGKLIVIQALAVVQLGYFTVLQFDKIPPTFIGFKYLLPSSGINNIGLVTSVDGQLQQILYRTMGLDSNIFANYNISFILLFFIPFLIGLIGFLVCKFTATISPKYQEIKQSLLSDTEKKRLKDIDINNHFTDNLRSAVFQRIMFQYSFYGLLTAGYLEWISVFNALKSPNGAGIFGFILILLIWIAYGVLYLKIHTQQLHLPQHYFATFQPQNTVILKGFGDFRDVYQQISKHNFYYSYAVQKVYISFILERIIVSILIVYVSDLFGYTSIIIALIYLIFLVVLIVSHVKYQNKKKPSDRKSLFSYLHRNYVFRQSLNFITMILVQMLYFVQAVNIQDTGAFVDTVSTNYLTTQLIPILILSFLYINFIINVLLWIWELKSTQIVRKVLEMKKFFLSKKDNTPYNYNPDEKKKRRMQNSSSKPKDIDTKRSVDIEDKMIQNSMRNYVEKSKNLDPKKSPFLGYKQSSSKSKSSNIQSLNVDSSRKINIQATEMTQKTPNKIYQPQDAV